MSATLSPPEFYTGLLGFEAGRTAFVEIPNPFPPENRRVVIDPTVETTWRQRPSNYDRIAERLAAFADAVPGNCLALFPSYGFLSEVTGRLRLRNKRVLVQKQADSDKERELILQCPSARPSSATSSWSLSPEASSPKGWTIPARS